MHERIWAGFQGRRATYRTFRYGVGVAALALVVTACGPSENNKLAYEGCIASAKKPGSKIASAQFATMDQAQTAGMQDSSIAVNVSFTLDGKTGLLQCSMIKQKDGAFRNQLE